MKQYLIADSGGTKTDWCLIDSVGQKSFFSSESCHPVNWEKTFFVRLNELLSKVPIIGNTELYFFGSGCYNQDNRKKLEVELSKAGFLDVTIKSDLHGAGYALFGKESGWGAIMGTGSVLFQWKEQEIVQLVGGKGHEFGDEGSGYYFGNSVYEGFLKKELNSTQHEKMEETLTKYVLKERKERSVLAEALSSNKELFERYHEKNIAAFYQTHLNGRDVDSIRILGGYGYHHSDIIERFLNGKQIIIDRIIEKPITFLVEQMGAFID